MRISVTVEPTCTVDVTSTVPAATQPISLACRNLREGQPEPIVFQTTPRDGHEVVLIRF